MFGRSNTWLRSSRTLNSLISLKLSQMLVKLYLLNFFRITLLIDSLRLDVRVFRHIELNHLLTDHIDNRCVFALNIEDNGTLRPGMSFHEVLHILAMLCILDIKSDGGTSIQIEDGHSKTPCVMCLDCNSDCADDQQRCDRKYGTDAAESTDADDEVSVKAVNRAPEAFLCRSTIEKHKSQNRECCSDRVHE